MRRALVVGIDDYPRAPLKGCVNDADAMAALLARHADGSPNFDVQRLTSDSASITRGNLLANIQRLFGHDDADVARCTSRATVQRTTLTATWSRLTPRRMRRALLSRRF